ncbi:MAG TPA: hypothetical protein VD907_02200 [Verrucomicrobiae bacterium]|nr:hypothetical protein [Verrucomicrobiae bacterium]
MSSRWEFDRQSGELTVRRLKKSFAPGALPDSPHISSIKIVGNAKTIAIQLNLEPDGKARGLAAAGVISTLILLAQHGYLDTAQNVAKSNEDTGVIRFIFDQLPIQLPHIILRGLSIFRNVDVVIGERTVTIGPQIAGDIASVNKAASDLWDLLRKYKVVAKSYPQH